MSMSTFYDSQAGDDFTRERRRRALGRISAKLRQVPDDVDDMLPFDEVLEALGSGSRRDLGVQTIPLDSIVGTVDRTRRNSTAPSGR